MNLKEIRMMTAVLLGFEGETDNPYFPVWFEDLAHQANEDVSRLVRGPTKLAYLDAWAGGVIPMPTDAWEDGILSIKYDYKNRGIVLQPKRILELESSLPNWTSTSFAAGTPQYYINDPSEVRTGLRLIPTPPAASDYLVLYEVKPLRMTYDSHEPLQSYDNDGITRLTNQMTSTHILVAHRTAWYFCFKMMYRTDLDKETRDVYAARKKAIETEYDAESAKIFNEQSAQDPIIVNNPLYVRRK
jgi:hypothetical protein